MPVVCLASSKLALTNRQNRDRIAAQYGLRRRSIRQSEAQVETRRFVNTLLLLLGFRILTAIPALNVDEERLRHLLAANPLIGTVDLFAGGETLNHFSIVAAGIFPYLVALILVQVAAAMSPRLREMQRNESGKKRLELISHLVTIPTAFLFAWALSHYLSQQVGLFPEQIHWFTVASFWPSLQIVCLVTFGSLLSNFLSHLITRKGIGSGTNVILLGGSSLVFLKQIVHVIQAAPSRLVAFERIGWILIGGALIVVFSIYMMSTQRRIPIVFAKREVNPGTRRLVPSAQPHLPFLLNFGRILPAFPLPSACWRYYSSCRISSPPAPTIGSEPQGCS